MLLFNSLTVILAVCIVNYAESSEWIRKESTPRRNAGPRLTMAQTSKVSPNDLPSLEGMGAMDEEDYKIKAHKIRPRSPKFSSLSDSDSSEENDRTFVDPQKKIRQMSKIEWFFKSLVKRSDSSKERIKHPLFRRRNLAIGRPCLRKSGKLFEHRTYPRSYEFPGFEASIPRRWDWRNVSGVNYCSPTRNQHIPVYCGSCWVFGSLGALNDRFNVARKNRWPMTFLSPQEIIDCNGKGNCQGGEVGNVYEHAKVNGLVEEGCNNYKAVNGECDPFHRCGTCWPDKCYGIENYTRYFIHDYGRLSGRENMMAEIHNRGPIACGIGATEPFDMRYTGGIYSEYSDTPSNHIVSVTGWGYDEETKTEYWIVRNSWGEAWGERGWFRIVTSLYRNGRGDLYNLGIERECYFADPDVSNLD